MYTTQNAGMGSAVVHEDGLCGKRKGPTEDLEKENADYGGPNRHTVFGMRRRTSRRDNTQIRYQEIRQGRKQQEETPAANRAETRREPGVNADLEAESNHAEDSHCQSHLRRAEAESPGEDEG
ncbi:hypothetical protein CHGG_08703 [Chaetomium globosum CBS 148.51]|uniref:Uncharacterized protein n=1 Tax=Chaetomium globosum (strain ATCC 6205 / CBS 148.51 / DSM 1962 / NBRC 6347 / NRRL 1970) TaxID=306901 RepID=Q2GTK1_CHAGB|nr:uncharacterized protein CHGG_08703 [Chaetomium globosum CBS 148.51]EAQ84689.1 hypothetical protein CHGG_08703 [Chaetomium globosum CBS 148.51]